MTASAGEICSTVITRVWISRFISSKTRMACSSRLPKKKVVMRVGWRRGRANHRAISHKRNRIASTRSKMLQRLNCESQLGFVVGATSIKSVSAGRRAAAEGAASIVAFRTAAAMGTCGGVCAGVATIAMKGSAVVAVAVCVGSGRSGVCQGRACGVLKGACARGSWFVAWLTASSRCRNVTVR